MVTTALATPEPDKGRGSATRPPTGLLLSIGAEKPDRGPGRPIDYIRPKEGQLEEYAAAAARFTEVYGDEPKQISDLFFLSNNIVDILSIRLMAWGASGPKVVGDTNYASLPPEEWEQRAFAFEDDITYFPMSAAEVKPSMRAAWNGEPIRGRLEGKDDPRIEKLQINIECTLSMCLPNVLGFGTVAQITTKGRASMRNLVSSLNDQHAFFQGQLIGIPFRLTLRPKKTRYFNAEKRAYQATKIFALVLDTPFTVQEAIDAIRERREALGAGQPGLGSPEARQLTAALALPPGERTQLRDEPAAEVDAADDATVNRIARLEGEVGRDAALVTLRGVFGVESATDLSKDDADRYAEILERSSTAAAADTEFVDAEDIEFG